MKLRGRERLVSSLARYGAYEASGPTHQRGRAVTVGVPRYHHESLTWGRYPVSTMPVVGLSLMCDPPMPGSVRLMKPKRSAFKFSYHVPVMRDTADP
jgi:hypothetical protein